MSVVEAYSNQYRWRRWAELYPYLGDVADAQLIDVGCGVGDQVRDLTHLGAHVVGIDAQPEVIAHASARQIPRSRFICDQIGNIAHHRLQADGIWTSFTVAYFPQFNVLLASLANVLKPGGWLAITELDGLLDHDPLEAGWRTLIEQYYAQSLAEGVYRFRSQTHVRAVLAGHGWHLALERSLDDDEFCFSGPANPAVADAWRQRLSFMMPRFTARYGERAAGFDAAFLNSLRSPQHHSRSRVWFILALKPAPSR